MRFFLFFLLSLASVNADFKKGTFLQDDEIEETTLLFVRDLFKAGGISHKPIVLFVVHTDINAAATLQGTMILFSAFILNCKNVNEFTGVLAHEAAHIKAAHPALRDFNTGGASVPGILAIALSGIAALATGSGEIFAAGAMGGLGMMERGYLKYSREQEDAADAGGIKILETLKWPVTGLASFLKMIHGRYNVQGADPYLQTHPLTNTRIEKITAYLNEHKEPQKVPAYYEERFLRMRGKVAGFTQQPQKTLRDYPISNKTVEARYGRTIAYYRLRQMDNFKREIDSLLSSTPGDTYFLELRGQFNFESGNKVEALKAFKLAKQGRKKNSFGLDVMTAHAIIESKGDMNEVIKLLTPHLEKDSEQAFAWRLLGTAYGRLGKTADASGCLAEEAFLKQDFAVARTHAKKAENATRPAIRDRAKTLIREIEIAEKKGRNSDS